MTKVINSPCAASRARVDCLPYSSQSGFINKPSSSQSTCARTRARLSPIHDHEAYFRAWRMAKFGGDFDPISVAVEEAVAAVPMLTIASLVSCLLVCLGGGFSSMDGVWCLVLFAVLLPLYCYIDRKGKSSVDSENCEVSSCHHPSRALVGGLVLLMASSHVLVWGAVGIARSFGVSELLIGLTVIAAGTSLPELASAFASTRRGQNELMHGNIIGSNFLNSVAVVGTSGATSPFRGFSSLVFTRDLPVMVLLTLPIGIFGFNLRNPRLRGTIPRPCGIIWLPHFSLI